MTTIDAHSATVYYGETAVSATSCTVRLDRGRSPFVRATVTIPAALGIDPRDGDRARINLRQVFGDSKSAGEISALHAGKTAGEISTLHAGKTAGEISALHFTPWNRFGVRASTSRDLDLVVVRSSTAMRRRETTLELASDEAAAQLFLLVQTSPITFGSLSARAVVSQVLGMLGATLGAGTADAVLEAPATWEPGVYAWDFLAPIVQQTGLRLWCDGRRTWRLDSDELAPAGEIVLSSRDRVTDATLDVDVDAGRWADAVVIRYRWRDTNNVERTRYDVAGAARPRRGVFISYDDTVYPGPGAAAHMLRRRQRLGRQAPVDAVSDYDVEPGQGFTLTLDGVPMQAGVVHAVEWRVPDADMTVEPADLEALDPDGIRAIPATYRINQLPGTIATLRPGAL